jgi:hypothetical protein
LSCETPTLSGSTAMSFSSRIHFANSSSLSAGICGISERERFSNSAASSGVSVSGA